MATASKSRQPRLRASCDGCFLAKVKCSKTRPVCSRCLSCGILCHYSPSSRAGKPKPDNNHSPQQNSSHDVQATRSFRDEQAMSYIKQPHNDHVFTQDRSWSAPSTDIESNITRNHSFPPGVPLIGYDTGILNAQEPLLASSDLYSSSISWEMPQEIGCGHFSDMPTMTQMPGSQAARSYSFDATGNSISTLWREHPHEMTSYSQVQTPSSYVSSPTQTPGIAHDSSSACITACCQAVVALHNASVFIPPPVDIVLGAARQAAEACFEIEVHGTLYPASQGTFTIAMLLATIIGKITSIYKGMIHTYFEPCSTVQMPQGSSSKGMAQTYFEPGSTIQMPESSSNTGMSSANLGGYQLAGGGGTLPQIEYLRRELRKLEGLFRNFRNVCPELLENSNFGSALMGYIGHSINSTVPHFESIAPKFESSTLEMVSKGETESPFATS